MKKFGRKIPEEKKKYSFEKLRGENRELRKEVARLRKENEKLKGIYGSYDEQEQDIQKIIEDTVYKPTCPKCRAFVKIFELREIEYFVCECGERGRWPKS